MSNRKNKPEVSMQRILVTPTMAQEWLDNVNIGNRNLRKKNVERMCRDAVNGNFLETHHPIAFDDKGILIDGQHRLTMVVRTGKPFHFWVAQNCDPNTRWGDTGIAPKSLADVAGWKYGTAISRRVESTIRAMMDPAFRSIHTVADRLEFYREHSAAIHWAVDALSTAPARVRKSQVIAIVARAYYTADRKRLDQFVEALNEGVITSKTDKPAIMLRDHLLSQDEKTKAQAASTSGRRWLHGRTQYLLTKFLERKKASDSYLTITKDTVFLIPGEKGYKATG